MWQVKEVARPRRFRAWFGGHRALVAAPWCSGSARCSSNSAPPQPQVINDKGTPFGDLLVPKLTASVKDGAVGVTRRLARDRQRRGRRARRGHDGQRRRGHPGRRSS